MSEEKEKPQVSIFDRITKKSELSSTPAKSGRGGRGGN
jgi:hypothetical protein